MEWLQRFIEIEFHDQWSTINIQHRHPWTARLRHKQDNEIGNDRTWKDASLFEDYSVSSTSLYNILD